MNLRFGVLADYAGQGAGNKGILVGIFDTLFNPQNAPTIQAPLFYLFASIEAHVPEGTEHRAAIHLTTADGADLPVPVRMELPFKLATRGPGRKMEGALLLALQGLPLPGNGAYEFNIFVDDRHIGAVPLYVSQPIPIPQ